MTEKQKAQSRASYWRNRDKKLAYQRKHYLDNLEAKRAYSNAWGRRNNDKKRAYLREYLRKNLNRQMLNSARITAKKKILPFALTLADIKIPRVCPYLGIILQKGNSKRIDASPSLDRIIPQLGYVPGNVEVISWRANRIKNDATPTELRTIAERLEHLCQL